MQPELLAQRPDVEIPGDRYLEMPPKPRVRNLATGVVSNVPIEDVRAADAPPYEVVPGLLGFMALNGTLMGVSKNYAVWRFGWTEDSPMGKTGIWMPPEYEHCVRCRGRGFHFEESEAEGTHCDNCEGAGRRISNIGFLWVLATRKAGVIKDQWRGWATNLPPSFRNVIDAPVIISCAEGYMNTPTFHPPTKTNVINPARRNGW